MSESDPSDELRYHILKERHKEDATISMIIFEAYIDAGFTRQEALEILINMMIGG